MEERELVVVKYGSSSIVRGDQSSVDNMAENIGWFSNQLASLHQNNDVIVVTSGAIAVGEAMWPDIDREDEDAKQFLAMSGNPQLMDTWIQSFRRIGIKAGELLLTHIEIEDDLEPDSPGSELRHAIKSARSLGAITLINENDALSKQEIAEEQYGGDNDGLAAHIARSLGASKILIMTDVNGVTVGAQRRSVVKPCAQSWDSVRRAAGPPNALGRGGMRKKVEAAISAAQTGIPAYIAPARNSFSSIIANVYGTYFEPVPRNIVE